jgi:DUF1365 family protein
VVKSALYEGTLMHARRTPVRNVFTYPVSYWLLDLDELPELDGRLALFSHNRRNVVSFRDRDHFDGGPSAKDAVLALVDDDSVERVLVLTQPRVLGYVFNPVSFWYCYRAGELATIVAETSNTFGEKLPYVLEREDGTGRFTASHEKRLHVSPFFPLDQEYRWWFTEPGDQVSVRIDLSEDGRRPFWATLQGRREELTNASLARALVRYPLMPQRVISLIHLQAARLWLKRVPFFHKPPFTPGVGSQR